MVMVQNLLVLNNMILFVDSFVPVFVVIEMHTQLNCFFLPGKVEDCTKNYRLSNTKNLCYLWNYKKQFYFAAECKKYNVK